MSTKDCRMSFIRDVELALSAVLEPDSIQMVSQVITKALADYELSERCTDLVPHDDENARILKRYRACLLVEGKSKKTVAQYSRSCERLAALIGKPFTEMGVYDVRFFLATEMERGVSDSTRETQRANLSAFFQWMTNEEIIQRNPIMSINPISFREKEKKPFTDVEIDALRGACKTSKERALIEVLTSTGMRVQELVDLNLDDIDFHTMRVKVLHGKGDKYRVVYTTRLALKYLSEYISDRKMTIRCVFCNRYGERITTGGVRKVLNTIAKRAGVDNVHPHRFRVTLASNLAARGMGVQDIQKILGHSNVDTTMGYIAVDDRKTHAEYNKYIA